MKRIARYALPGLFLLTLRAQESSLKQPGFQAEVAEPSLSRHVLTNQAIVLLAEAGYDEGFLIDLIQYKQTRFDTTVEGLTFLAKHGISERIIRSMIANENKPASSSVAAPAAPEAAQPMAVRARVVRQKILVPDLRATPQPIPVPSMSPGTKVQPVNGPWTAAGYQYQAAPAAPPYVMIKRHLFWKRAYVVNPYNAPATPAAPMQRPAMPAYSQLSSFPAW